MLESVKQWVTGTLKSLTIWFNSIAASFIIFLPELQANLPQLMAYLPADVYKWLALTVVVSNMVLRFKTNSALNTK